MPMSRKRAAGVRGRAYDGGLSARRCAARIEFGQLLLAKDPLAYERNYQFDITPVSDNRPFFFYTVQPRDVAAFHSVRPARKSADVKVNVAVPKLFDALIVSIVAVAVILLLPPLVLGTRLPRERSVRSFPAVFSGDRRGLHSDRSGADSEVRAVPRASDLRADGGDLLHAGFERRRAAFASRKLMRRSATAGWWRALAYGGGAGGDSGGDRAAGADARAWVCRSR